MTDDTRMSAYLAFRDVLEQMNKESCVQVALKLLESNTLGVAELYTQVLAPALNNMTEEESDKSLSIWREHIRSSIIRTIIECSYPYLIKELNRKGVNPDKGTVVIVSPSDEYHELGARMGADFFNLCGYRTIFVGSDTPKHNMVSGLKIEQAEYVVINVVNFYNIVKVKAIIAEILAVLPEQKILVSGYAFRHDKDLYKTVGAIGVINSIDDIRALESAGGKA